MTNLEIYQNEYGKKPIPLAKLRRYHALLVLEYFGYDQTNAAKALGVARKTLCEYAGLSNSTKVNGGSSDKIGKELT